MRRRELLSTSSGGNGRKMIGDYEVVDLGLPSGLLWATCNIGTNSETGYGNYYMYGKGSREYNASDSIYEGMEDPLAPTADTATQVMENGWRMPTRTEFQELTSNTNYSWTYVNSRRGGKFTSKTNPNAYVFFPADGVYINGSLYNLNREGIVCSSTPYSSNDAYSLSFNDTGGMYVSYGNRGYGLLVRGVHAAV